MKKNCRVQYLAIKDEVDKLLEQGYSYTAVYQNYKDQGKIEMSYQSWLRLIKTTQKVK